MSSRGLAALASVAVLGTVTTGCGVSASSNPASTSRSSAAASTQPASSTQQSSGQPLGFASTESVPPLFNALSPWNTQVATLPADPSSPAMLALGAQGGRGGGAQGGRGGGIYINSTSWTPTIATDQGGVPTKLFCRQILCGSAANGLTAATIPPAVNPDPRYDGWLTVINRGEGVAYDFWRARRQADGSISYQYVKRWNLNGPGFSKPASVNAQNAVAARGSGLPLFAGVILPGELRAGAIDHTLAISIPAPATASYVPPASTTDGAGPRGSLPEGARIRLRASIHLGRLPGGDNRRNANIILTALKRYGAIVVDRSTVPTLYAQKDAVSGLLTGNELQSLRLSDFEVVRLPARLQGAPAA